MTPLEGIDCATTIRDAEALKRAGKAFVCRYISTPGNSKNLGLSEAKRLRAAGLAVVVVFETTAVRALNGEAAGARDARSARKQLDGCGLPPTVPVYFAVDFDATPAQQDAINSYLSGAASVLGKGKTGVYGGYWVVKRALDAGVCGYGWQTYAWSTGPHHRTLWDSRAQLQQYRNGVRVAGVDCDLDRATVPDYGQWPRPVGDGRPAWARQGDKLKPMWAWILWKDHGEPADLRPKQVPVRVPKWWFVRYRVHTGWKPRKGKP